MVCQDHIVLLLIQAVGVDDLKGVLLGIDGALLQRHIDLREGHRGGVGAQRLPDGDVQLVLHDPDLLSLHVVRGLDLDVAGHLTHALVEEADELKAFILVFLLVEAEDRLIVHGIPELLGILIEEREINGIQLRDEIGGECGGPQEEGHITGLCRFAQLSVGPHGAVEIHLELDAAAGDGVKLIRHVMDQQAVHAVLGAVGGNDEGVGVALGVVHRAVQFRLDVVIRHALNGAGACAGAGRGRGGTRGGPPSSTGCQRQRHCCCEGQADQFFCGVHLNSPFLI